MQTRIGFKQYLAPNAYLDVLGRYTLLLSGAMGQHDYSLIRKEVKKAIVNPLEAGTKLIDPLLQIIAFRPAELISQIRQTFNAGNTFVPCLVGQSVQPLEYRDRAVLFSVKDKSD